ncbi:M23 family metallopeptidase [Brevibacillus sp. HB1.2]|uniref:M23 family metallopeptidase n=1 Tax=Brevibacillus TaxID=55080 RepID=UPI00037C50A7|nr:MULTISPECIES: M23 family metallopeptidase [unclassified Brevibacillus]ATF15365.1 M23 family peptidase [Brevibacillus brevis X23]MDC0762508.1 M23 family metallopeptidase [Brevibacillus sp. AG]NRS17657.1 M23 family metallopeptidase [Brevibacillus sp. HB1.4B]NTU23007.1 M23 family metallopeptidase [Brevibacillus sp. HB1.2]NTU31997.1 M23 family metallopeptidase [Brevibacillus sp. HB1.1]
MRVFRLIIQISLCVVAAISPLESVAGVAPSANEQDPVLQERLQVFLRLESMYGIPWNYLAAIDQYERTMKIRRKKQEQENVSRLTAVDIPSDRWAGAFNPDAEDTNPVSIQFFKGIGMDGDGDGVADRHNDLDALTTFIHYLSQYGFSHEDWQIGLWSYYQRDRSVKTIRQFAQVYAKYHHLHLDERHFPIPARYDYSYRSTWGAPRGWGGRRIHEGTDIFASHGTPVLSTAYGVIEVIGWNRFGGWRIGMRDMGNVYHYFAHLSSFKKGLKPGDIVEPGEVLGYIGSSGYGKPGTSGKFPPHLHYGMYRETGGADWSFDPYPYLRRWERQKKRQ